MCTLWGNGTGCDGEGRLPQKSRTASAVVRWAGVKMVALGALDAGAAPQAPPRLPPAITGSSSAHVRVSLIASVKLARESEAAHVVDDVPHLLLGELGLEAFHVELGPGAVANDREDLAIRRASFPRVVSQIRRVRSLRRHRAVAFPFGAVTEPAIFLERLAAGRHP